MRLGGRCFAWVRWCWKNPNLGCPGAFHLFWAQNASAWEIEMWQEKKRCVWFVFWVFEDHLFHPFSGNQGVLFLGVHGFNPLGGNRSPTFRNAHDGSMGRKVLFAYVYHKNQRKNVGKYTIYGSYGILKQGEFQCFPGVYILHCWTCFRWWKSGIAIKRRRFRGSVLFEWKNTHCWIVLGKNIFNENHGPLNVWGAEKANMLSSWWFQPIWKILVKMGIFPK